MRLCQKDSMTAPSATRRRGPALERAIHAAGLAELIESGYTALTLERVARRAGTGKAALYRRWPSKRELVADAVSAALPELDQAPDTGSVRTDLLACFEQMHRLLDGPARLAVQALTTLGTPSPDPILALIRDRVLEPRIQVVLDVLLKGVARGEVRAEAAVPILARTGPALLFQHLLLYGTPPPRSQLVDIVDRVVLPAARPPASR